jgi:hypothetical protein
MYILHKHMNVETGTEAALFPEKEYIMGIFFAVHIQLHTHPTILQLTTKQKVKTWKNNSLSCKIALLFSERRSLGRRKDLLQWSSCQGGCLSSAAGFEPGGGGCCPASSLSPSSSSIVRISASLSTMRGRSRDQ